jgi:hypothetical protein
MTISEDLCTRDAYTSLTDHQANQKGLAMKTILSFLCTVGFVVMISTTQSAHGADTNSDMSAIAFADLCTNTALAYRDGKSLPRDSRLLSRRDPIYVGKNKYEVKIFTLPRDQTPGHGLVQTDSAGSKIVGLIGKGPETDQETPRFTAICLDRVPHPSTTGQDGDIEFHTGDNVTSIGFRLNKIANDPERLEKTSWKSKAHKEDTIWLVGPFEHNGWHTYPTKTSWPKCLEPKNVDWDGGANVSFAFKDCAAPTSKAHDYLYAVHMDRINSAGVAKDFVLDPKIINRP